MLQFTLTSHLNIIANRKLSISKTLIANHTIADAIRIITAKGMHRLVRMSIDQHVQKGFSDVNPKELVYEISCLNGYLYTQQVL